MKISPKNNLLLGLMKSLISEPAKIAIESESPRSLTVFTWQKDHARLVGRGGETIYALRKLAEFIGIRLTLKEPVPEIEAPAEERDFKVAETVKSFHEAAGDPDIELEELSAEGMTEIKIRGSLLTPDFARAMTLVCRKIGTITKRPIEIMYED